ncbi:MAG TPA: carboxypeptidase [Firmicutes bacterium]|nr:carboxypeptidase [Candidatus Fermentithermobacillaceae bacterium]
MELRFDHYYLYGELESALKGLAEKYPRLMTLESAGKTPEGRDIWAVTITDRETGCPSAKPAFYFDGNHHAGEVTGSMISMYIIDYLLKNYGKDERVTKILRNYTVYAIPRVSPDGAEVYLTTPETLRSVPRPYPYPNPEEKEGLYPADVDGDGEILLMRVKDPSGEWKVSPKDPRALVRRRPDEDEGTFYRVYTEGFIRDYDGGPVKLAPPKWGIDLNRNYPYSWAPDTRQPGAGEFPLSEPETRAVAEFVASHPNISLAFTFHTTGGVILRVPGSHPASKSPHRDIETLIAIGEMGTEETGYPCIPCYEDFSGGNPDTFSTGAFDDWLYEHRGILAYTVETWNQAQRAGVSQWPRRPKSPKEQEEDFLKLLEWNDRELGGAGFVPWRPFNHPQLGPVEIGGWRTKFVVQNAPRAFLEGECHKNCMFALRAMMTLPRLTLDRVTVRPLGDGVYHLSAVVRNVGYLSSSGSYQARLVNKAKPIEVFIAGDSIEVVGKAKKEIGHLDGRAGDNRAFAGGYYRGGADVREAKVEWVVKGKTGTSVIITVQGERAGVVRATVTL